MLKAVAPKIAVVAAGVAAAASSSDSLAHAHADRQNEARTINQVGPFMRSSTKPASYSSITDDEWDFCLDDEKSKKSATQATMGPVPSEKEAREATSEILKGSRSRQCAGSHLLDRDLSIGRDAQNRDMLVGAGACGQQSRRVIHRGEIVDQVAHIDHLASNDRLSQALNLFERDPAVQDTVTSLAQDPNVWFAVQQNEAVKRMLQRRRGIHSGAADAAPRVLPQVAAKNAPDAAKHGDPVQDYLRDTITNLRNIGEKVASFFAKLFGFESKQNAPEGANKEEFDFIACLVLLTVLAVGVVMFKRVPGKLF
eukprot:jgi/Mesen1/10648/ME000009S10438